MRRLIAALLERIGTHLPVEFKVLHQQFLLRAVDLEALSIEADIPRFLGQFAGVLIMLSLCHGFRLVWFPRPPIETWQYEQARIADLQLVIGLCSVLMWDTTFPDRRDVMVLGPLPVVPRIILLAKLTASATVLSIAVATLNCASSLGMAVVFDGEGGIIGMARFFAAWWFALFAAAAFIYGAVLTVQGLGALLLPRRLFLRVSAILQIAVFAGFLAGRFLQPWLTTWTDLTRPAHHALLAYSPNLLALRALQSAQRLSSAGTLLGRSPRVDRIRRRLHRLRCFPCSLLPPHHEANRGTARSCPQYLIHRMGTHEVGAEDVRAIA